MGKHAGSVGLVSGTAASPAPAIASRLLADGASVTLALTEGDAAAVLQTYPILSGNIRRVTISDPGAWTSEVQALLAQHGTWNLAVVCAGDCETGTVETVDGDLWSETMRREVEPLREVARLALKHFGPDGGAILTVCPPGGTVAGSDCVLHDTVGGALRLMSKSIAAHCLDAALPIRCNAALVIPSLAGVDDPAGRNPWRPSPSSLARGQVLPALPADVAASASFLLSREAAAITGAELAIDGGRTAR